MVEVVTYDSTQDNQYTLFIFEPLQELTRKEFPGVNLEGDGGQSFMFTDGLNTLNETRTRGEDRTYEIQIDYDYHGGGTLDRRTRKRLSNIAERFKRMVHNYRDFTVAVNWIDEGGTWGNTTHTWGVDQSKYCWDMGIITEIDMNQDSFDDVREGFYRVRLIFQCFREEVVRN